MRFKTHTAYECVFTQTCSEAPECDVEVCVYVCVCVVCDLEKHTHVHARSEALVWDVEVTCRKL